jgi:hypothetical protein
MIGSMLVFVFRALQERKQFATLMETVKEYYPSSKPFQVGLDEQGKVPRITWIEAKRVLREELSFHTSDQEDFTCVPHRLHDNSAPLSNSICLFIGPKKKLLLGGISENHLTLDKQICSPSNTSRYLCVSSTQCRFHMHPSSPKRGTSSLVVGKFALAVIALAIMMNCARPCAVVRLVRLWIRSRSSGEPGWMLSS